MNVKKRIMTVLIAGIAAAGAVHATLPAFAADKAADAQSRPFSLPSERIEAQLAYAKTALKITSAQEAQWKAYADAQRKQAADLDKVFKERREAWSKRDKDDKKAVPQDNAKDKLTSVERLQKRKEFLDNAEKQLDSRIALYKVLTTEQQQIADEVLGGAFGGGFEGGPHRGKGGWGHGDGCDGKEGPRGHGGPDGFGPPPGNR